ncbi:MAG: hypothetical protein DBY38_10590 [Clostridium cadaveris]|uniref:Restriction endonuclease type IV Mrr domain-containing protein n=1 Tax=Clostridium cadaveris TaxID=1529 RepID=A0A316M2Z7_9CLOT|nr:MAG: hypothetical protein DBY38_10590 [Clostridium cadaveris]
MSKNIYSEFQEYRAVFAKLAKDDPDFLKKEIFEIRGENLVKYNKLYEDVKASYKNNSKGKKLENLTRFLMIQSKMYEVISNLRDNSNEIDLLVKLNDLGIAEKDILPDFLKENETMILECKNYNKRISVTWLGKFYNLLKMRDLKLGIIFSYLEFGGTGEWDSAKGLAKKIYLKDKIIILNFYNEDFENIKDGKKNILSLLNEKYENLVFMTDIDKHRSKHPAEDAVV